MRGRRWVVGGMWALLALLGGRAALGDPAASFPDSVFQFVTRAGLIRAEDHNQLGREIAAVEGALGANLSKIVTARAPTLRLDDVTANTLKDHVWRAPEAGRIVAVTCDTGGANSAVLVDLRIDDGT